MPPRATSAEPAQTAVTQTIEQIARALDEFLAEHVRAVVLEDGRVLFDMRVAKYRLATEHGCCTLHLWSEERNLVRRVSATTMRNGVLRLSTHPADAGVGGRPRPAYAVHTRSNADKVSASAGTGVAAKFP